MRTFSSYLTRRLCEHMDHPDVQAIVNTAYQQRDPHSLLIACDRMDDISETELSSLIRAHFANPSMTTLLPIERLMGFEGPVVAALDVECRFWSRSSLPGRLIAFTGRGPQVYWLGCKGGDPRVCLFGAMWTRPGNKYDPRRRSRPKSWLVACPQFIVGELWDGLTHEHSTPQDVMYHAVGMLSQPNIFGHHWSEGHGWEPRMNEKLYALLHSLLPAPQ